MSRLNNFKSKQPQSQLLKEGTHDVRLIGYLECTSFDDLKGLEIAGQKVELPDWTNPTEQLAILVGNADGVITHRLNYDGWKRFAELSDKEIKSGKYVDVQGFACLKDKKGLVRIPDPDRTAKCATIMEHFIWSLGQEEGIDAQDCLDAAIADKTLFTVKITTEEYEGNEQYRIASFKRLSEKKATVDSGLES